MKINNMKTIEAVDENICTGCGACYNACPKGAITMQSNREGFLFPAIDHDKCIDCGICLKSCAAYNPHYKNAKDPECYAVRASEDVCRKSSSGGMFTLLANYVLDQGGYVCGAAWDDDFNVEHILIHDKKDLDRLRYSKYVQSNTKRCYAEVGRLLKDGHKVLFTGTPCQIAGVYHYLRKDYDNLITADVVCHGTPSQKVWQDFLNTLPYRKEIVAVNFRPKEDGWAVFKLTFTLRDGQKIKLERSNPYFAGFEKALYFRRSCGTCPFNHLPRQADITLGDFWGLTRIEDGQLFSPAGTSCILLNSDKGKTIFKRLRSNMLLGQAKDLREAIKYNSCIHAPSEVNLYNRTKFFKLRRRYDFQKSVDFAINNKFDVGIIGIWFFENYGAIMTAFALYKVLESQGFYALLVDLSGFVKNYEMKPDNLSLRFVRRQNVSICSPKSNKMELLRMNRIVDNWVLASDQLWRFPNRFGKTFLLDFAHDNKRKIAVATSFGDPYVLKPSERESVIYHMKRLDRISVREDSGVAMCKNVFGVHAEHLLDPIFLCDRSIYDRLVLKSKLKEKRKFLLCYILDSTYEIQEYTKQTAKKMGLERVYLTDANAIVKGTNAQQGVEVEDWLYYFKNAEAIITDSFHGTCFAMIFHKPFLSIVNYLRGAGRFTSLMKIFGEDERLILSASEVLEHDQKLKSFDAEHFEAILEEHKKHDLAWIKDAMTFEKRKGNISSYDVLSEEIEALSAKLDRSSSLSFNMTLSLLLNRRRITRRYYRYKMLRKITWGKARKHYERKYAEAEKRYLKIKETVKNLRDVH